MGTGSSLRSTSRPEVHVPPGLRGSSRASTDRVTRTDPRERTTLIPRGVLGTTWVLGATPEEGSVGYPGSVRKPPLVLEA